MAAPSSVPHPDTLRNRLSERAASIGDTRLGVVMVGLFLFSRGLYYLLGVRFDASTLGTYQQFLDPELLKTNLLESIFYLHSQPPLFNLFLGGFLQLSPGHHELLFQAVYLVAGLGLYLLSFLLMRRLGVSSFLAFTLSTLFAVSPSYVLYENWLFYTFPAAVLLTLSAWLLHRVVASGATKPSFLFFSVLVLLGGVRGIYHLVYFVFVFAAILVFSRAHRKRILLAGLIPLIVLTSFYVKNKILFGQFTTSTWTGMNFSTMTIRNLPLAERERLVASGALSEVSLTSHMLPLDLYPAEFQQVSGYEAVPALRQIEKSTGYPNFNHVAYIGISNQFMQDSLYVLRYYPKAYLVGLARSWFAYFRSSADYFKNTPNRNLRALIDVYDYLFFGKIPFDLSRIPSLPMYTNNPQYIYIFLVVGLPLMVVAGGWLAVKSHPPAGGFDLPQRIVILYLVFNIGYLAVVSNLFIAGGDNYRYRFITDPLSVILLGVLIQRVRVLRRRI